MAELYPIIAKGVDRGIVSLERVSAIERVCNIPSGYYGFI